MGPAIQDLTKNDSDVSFTSWISQNSDLQLQITGYVARLDFSNFLVVTVCENEKTCVKCELDVCFQDEWYNRGKKKDIVKMTAKYSNSPSLVPEANLTQSGGVNIVAAPASFSSGRHNLHNETLPRQHSPL